MRAVFQLFAGALLISYEPPSKSEIDGGQGAITLSIGDWAKYSQISKEQRFSRLKQIGRDTIDRLGLAGPYEFDTSRGQEATPLVVGGVIYTTIAWNKVFAIDGANGDL